MIERTTNNVHMSLKAVCTWGEACDVSIFQSWKHPQMDIPNVWVQLRIEEARLLIEEIQAAIDKAETLYDEYAEQSRC